jgi:hypothetical protein
VGKGRVILDAGAKQAAAAAVKAVSEAPATGPVSYPDIYPDYETAARVLKGMGVAPDFESDGIVRYTHRCEGAADYYFVASREERPTAATCRFRVSGRAPEWWDPLTGECRDLPEYKEEGGVTVVPLRFEALQSGFVVFRKPAGEAKVKARNFPEMKTILTVGAPWEVAFDPRWGGPEKAVFSQLEDWSKRPEAGIKYYSGKATYRKAFDLSKSQISNFKSQIYLGLGDVKNLASVKVNGTDLGSVWCAPWRVKVPTGLLKENGNTLEITVANLWINRLIGDAGLPREKRLAWTT